MSHASNIVHCTGPADPHALDGISRRNRSGDLDKLCPVCAGHGQWNTLLDLVSRRSIRHACPECGTTSRAHRADSPCGGCGSIPPTMGNDLAQERQREFSTKPIFR